MNLIVTEKNISAERIARILAGKRKVSTERDKGISIYSFDDTVVVGLKGHVVEVDFVPGYDDWRSTEKTPRSLIDAGTRKVPTEKRIISTLQKLAKKAGEVIIATDFDTEGELIGKEAVDLIREVNPKVPVKRVRFSAITPQEIQGAFSDLKELDLALASAGEARQVIDLVWGASLTRFISIAARRGGKNILSVGRVQSPTLAMIVDREKEIEAFVPEKYWTLQVNSEKEGAAFTARHATARFTVEAEAKAARDRTRPPLSVLDVKEGEKLDRAPAPFDTTGFLVAAGRLGFSAANAMRIAEDLYMNGFISYPRTDNTVYPKSLSLESILAILQASPFAKDATWVRENRRKEPTRGKKVSTDHPPIHPTGAATREMLGEDRWRVYELVVRRFLATLSPDAVWKTVRCALEAGGEPYVATGARLAIPGWRRVYPYSEAEERVLPPLAVGDRLPVEEVLLEEKETQPPPRYTQSRLIQRMEELGLGTKSTRHEVIAKLLGRRYVEGNPLRPTPVGMGVIESLEDHADAITKPEMTRTLEADMQEIKVRNRTRDFVIGESREMLHKVFDALEMHGDEIGREIMERADEERVIGPCPACGAELRIRTGGVSQFVGCSRYPECGFNINLPSAQWGKAIKTGECCPEHRLSHIRLIRKGARPWDIGCPLCSHIRASEESMALIPSMTTEIMKKLRGRHIYTVSQLSEQGPENLAGILGISPDEARRLLAGAGDALALLRRRSELRRFLRAHLPPRKGRSRAELMKRLSEKGIEDLPSLSRADAATLGEAGIGPKEAAGLLGEARSARDARVLRDAGIPAASLKRYQEAGFARPEDFCFLHPVFLADRTGLSLDTVYRHATLVCEALGSKPPVKVPKARVDKGRQELLGVPGLGEATLEKFHRAGILDRDDLRSADPVDLAKKTGIDPSAIRGFAGHFAKKGKG
ncbi:MAG TPA: DNA topoisomerase I [Methanomicrobiales archaeon]|nr:DNA topoisomerase I [Methanomicrobiales archaeon]